MPCVWEHELDHKPHIEKGLVWAFYRVHKNVHPQDIEKNGPINVKIHWSVPICTDFKPLHTIMVVVEMDRLVEPTDLMGRQITRCICEKQEAAETNVQEAETKNGAAP
ncbi:uncharacterized protein ARMOST_15522 [Armillaria ostoyae]|uniref:Uncharacterized protein n=1 Tax=Armillaria ostoyae TaxID=47428 RepID=A0A284RTI7_ARMOS|nr:uncharacterized protein ARMOST_15522 [Armillaria ostoyae]